MAYRHSSDPGLVERQGSSESPGSGRPEYLRTTSTASSSSSIRKRLRNFTLSPRKTETAGGGDTWGQFGLRLLHAPPDPLIDFIFIHGLRGGSVKTWCKGDDLRLFWPQTWLPRDPGLQNVRIHSFGYNSDWGDTADTTLDIHDFGRSLVGEITTSPELRKGNQTPILLIGHSMGGLVMKKAFLLAQQDEQAQQIAKRIQCMFFLATPHRGSDSAALLNNILRASVVLSSKPYITDLNKNSSAISVINDEFRFLADNLRVWSFYETVKTRIGTSSVLIVERDSAIIGHKHEIVTPLNADHRNVCKFDSPADPNYVLIRNSLVKATEDVLGDVFEQRAEEVDRKLIRLESFLQISGDPEDDLAMIESKKTSGSCEWIKEQSAFRDWRDSGKEGLLCFWLSGQAGAGKSVLATHLIRDLHGMGLDTCYFFFRHGQKAQQTSSSLLRNIAFQMAMLHPGVREVLHGMQEAGVVFDKDDERAIWRKIFVNSIMPVSISTPQFWVIDGLDECVDYERLLPLLYKFESAFHVRILFISRRLFELEKLLSRFENRLFRHHISIEDSRSDIELFAQNNSRDLPVDTGQRSELINKLVQKSDGAFLWMELAFESLGMVFSEDDIDEALERVPVGMAPLYGRILDGMATNTRQLKLMRAILEWNVCGVRPLTTDELQAALSLSLKTKILQVGRVVEELCGQLLRIDGNGVVQMVHATARDFLLSNSSNSEFSMEKAVVNEHLAMICLECLVEEEMRPPRHPALLGSRTFSTSVFLDYACTCFSEHLASSSSSSDRLFLLLDKFFRTNVLSWAEYILSKKKSLYYMLRTSKNLRKYLDRRAKHSSPIGGQFSNLEKWQTDLLRIALKFGSNLLQNPSSIHFIVPPLCPSDTSIHQQFGSTAKGLYLSGLAGTTWDDCICYIDYRQSRALALAACDGMFAIGMKSGAIKLYQQTTCQEIISIAHGEPVKMLRFDDSSRHLASAGFRQLKLWSTTGELLWSVQHGCHLSVMDFTEGGKTLITLDKNSNVVTWSTKDGRKILTGGQGDKSNPNLSQGSSQSISSADISPKTELLAIAYRGRPVQIWSIQQDILLRSCHRERDKTSMAIMSPTGVLFNPNPAIDLVAVTYLDGDVAIFSSWSHREQEITSVSADAVTLAGSPDGRTLATGDAIGTIKLWDFETLSLLYSIKSSEYEVKSLAFSGDGYRLYDIRDTKTKIWEPSALVRKSVSEDSSISESVAVPALVAGRDTDTIELTQILAPPGAGCIFVGRDDGTVLAYDWMTGEIISKLYSHRRDVFVTSIAWNESMIATADASSKIEVHPLAKTHDGQWTVGTKAYETKCVDPILSIVLHPTQPLLLTFQARCTTLVDVHTDEEYSPRVDENEDYCAWSWLCGPETELLLGAHGSVIDIYTEEQWKSGGEPTAWHLMKDGKPISQTIQRMLFDASSKYVAVILDTAALSSPNAMKVLIYQAPQVSTAGPDETKVVMAEEVAVVIWSHEIHTFFGFYEERIVFLDHKLWVHSIDLSKAEAGASLETLWERHFFVPREFIGSNNGIDGMVSGCGTMIFPKEGELAIVRNAFEWSFTGGELETIGVLRRRDTGLLGKAK